MDSKKDHSKVFYSVDSFPSKDINPLPSKEVCKMCQCHVQAHAIYWQCPLLNGYICSSCCQEEVPLPSNLDQLKSKTTCISLQDISNICGPCKKNSLQD